MPPVRYSVTQLGGGQTAAGVTYPGGLDLTTPSLRLQPGALRDVLNFECAPTGGYARIEGYERKNGRPAPSAALYQIVQVDALSTTPDVGQTVIQEDGTLIAPGASAVVITGTLTADYYYTVANAAGVTVQGTLTVQQGASATSTGVVVAVGSPYLVLTKITGAFNTTGRVSIARVTPVGTAVTQTVTITSLLDAVYTAGAADSYRADINAVPGSGSILGVVGMNFLGVDCLFAFRANAGGTAVSIYKASTSGWTLVPMPYLVSFTAGGTATPVDGDTLTQGGVTAVIKRVMTQSGAWTGSAVGSFVIDSPSGGNFASGAATTSGGATITLSGVQSAVRLAVGGRFEFTKANFSGQAVTRRIYGCDGVNKCFEFDGVTLAPIATGLSPDTPSHITNHKNFLFVSKDSSLLYCGVGTPFKWSTVDGGGEIATGDTVTGMLTMPSAQTSATLAVFLKSNTSYLYGLDPTSFNYVASGSGLGALPYSAQNMADTFAFDNVGAFTLRTTINYGNFLPSTLTKNILPFIVQERSKLVASSFHHTKSQYRVFFSDGYGLWMTMVNQQYLGAGIAFFPSPVSCCDEGDLVTGAEVTYFGSSDGLGYVYQMDAGTSFDGVAINSYITCAWDAIKSPRVLKRFRAASVEVQGTGYAAFSFGYQLGYGSSLIGQPTDVVSASAFQAAPVWDVFTWDEFTWDGQTLIPSDVDATGTGESIQVTISANTNYMAPFTLNSIIYHYTPRRGMRV